MSHNQEADPEVKRDGRILKVEISGASNGVPIFLMHGTPGSRSGPKPRASVLYRLGVRMICHDRPGYGGSSRHEGRTVADVAGDVRAIADDLDIDRFMVVGRSGGGPHALACAALMPDRVIRAAALVSIAPPAADGLDWFDGMADTNVDDYSEANRDFGELIEQLRVRADLTRNDPDHLIEKLLTEMSRPDRRVVKDYAIRRLLTENYAEALREGPYGWIDDVAAFSRPWGFQFEDIRCPVRLWHGTEDKFAPVSHTRWLASRLASADLQVEVQSGSGHFGAVEVLPRVLAWLADGGERPRTVASVAASARVAT